MSSPSQSAAQTKSPQSKPQSARRSRSQSESSTEPQSSAVQSSVFGLDKILGFIEGSGKVMSALYKDIMTNEQTKTFVLNILKSVATAYIVKKTTAQVTQPVIDQTKVILNNHTYSGSFLRKLLTHLLMTIVVSAGITGVYISREKIKSHIDGLVRKMDLKSVMGVLSGIAVAVVDGLKTIHTKAADSFRRLLQTTELDGGDKLEPPDTEEMTQLLRE